MFVLEAIGLDRSGPTMRSRKKTLASGRDMDAVIEYASKYCGDITPATTFLPMLLRIVDSEGRLVCGATVDKQHRVLWTSPIRDETARQALRRVMRRCNNLYRRSKLSLTLVAPQYANVAASLASSR
ncbi:hypothetical protein [Ferrimonas kyonanensis]|uniref:hypothetical protein n=1 Tax=Ferrimonas kyonanensis TaxID=364763 RepID=UPI0004868C53|nr:hypothetical protein [Ferrimonas kyonanensis]